MEFSPLNNDLLAIRTINNIISIYDLNEYKETEEQMKPKYTLKPECEIVLMTFNPVNPNIYACVEKKEIYVYGILIMIKHFMKIVMLIIRRVYYGAQTEI